MWQTNGADGDGIPSGAPLVDAAQTLHTTGLVAVVVLALVGWLVAERRA